MIDILYAEIKKELSAEQWSVFIIMLPQTMQEKVSLYKRWQDRQASLFGKLLLRECLINYGYCSDCLESISIDKYGRPFLNNDIDFNISHSHDYVICAISKNARVGIDIEKISKKVNIMDFSGFINPKQFEMICNTDDSHKIFYEIWTKNEAVSKADGKGLSIPVDTVFKKGQKATLNGKAWFLKEINIDINYCCHLATDFPDLKVCTKKVNFIP